MTRTQTMCVVASTLAMLAMGGRVQISKYQHQPPPGVIKDKGNVIQWTEGDIFLCAQKWEKKSGKHTGHYCLVESGQVEKGTNSIIAAQKSGKNTPRIRVATPDHCMAKSRKGRMKVCNLKGKEDMRVYYSARVLIPQKCFMLPRKKLQGHMLDNEGDRRGTTILLPVLQAAVASQVCMDFMKQSGKFFVDEQLGVLSPTPPREVQAPAEDAVVEEAESPAEEDSEEWVSRMSAGEEEEGDDWEETDPEQQVHTVPVNSFDNIKSMWQFKDAQNDHVPKPKE